METEEQGEEARMEQMEDQGQMPQNIEMRLMELTEKMVKMEAMVEMLAVEVTQLIFL